MQALYQLDVQGPDIFEHLGRFFKEADPDDFVRNLASDWSNETWENLEQCDQLITDPSIKAF